MLRIVTDVMGVSHPFTIGPEGRRIRHPADLSQIELLLAHSLMLLLKKKMIMMLLTMTMMVTMMMMMGMMILFCMTVADFDIPETRIDVA